MIVIVVRRKMCCGSPPRHQNILDVLRLSVNLTSCVYDRLSDSRDLRDEKTIGGRSTDYAEGFYFEPSFQTYHTYCGYPTLPNPVVF
jgi:hypothetical protein